MTGPLPHPAVPVTVGPVEPVRVAAGPVEPVRVAAGPHPSGRAPMTWGQLAIWRPHIWFGADSHVLNMPSVLTVDPPVPLDRCLAAIAAVVERVPALRTRFGSSPDGPYQEAVPDGVLPVRIVRPDAGEPTGPLAEAVSKEMAATPFDLTTDWPIRVAAVVEDDRVTRLALTLSHVAVDGWGARRVFADLHTELRSAVHSTPDTDLHLHLHRDPAAPAAAPPPQWTALDQAAFERSEVGAARSALAVQHWRQALSAVPGPVFADPPRMPRVPADGPRFHRLRIESRAAAVAAGLLARRSRTSTSTVLLTAVALLLAALTERDSVPLQLIVGNRHDERSRGLAAAMAQNGLFVHHVDPAADFTSTLRTTYRRALAAYCHGHYDPVEIDAVVAEVSAARGVPSGIDAYFNDARMEADFTDLPTEVRAEEWDAFRSRTTVETVATLERHDATFFAHLAHHPEECHLLLLIDTAHVPASAARAGLFGIERLLVEAARRHVPIAEATALLLPPASTRERT
ncbi:condensation domain-containing protein [Kitasatospora sp. NPDC058965]|uniref:condensation domain-containing protein n=1 Tax=Kitasatospora sp. NPDC058965 TaxID=3346682 RepID=UPI00367B1836